LGLDRFTELDERDAFVEIAFVLQAANDAGQLDVKEPEILGRLLLGALTRGATLIASSPHPSRTRKAVGRTIRDLLFGLQRK
jgi:hypothetical protein